MLLYSTMSDINNNEPRPRVDIMAEGTKRLGKVMTEKKMREWPNKRPNECKYYSAIKMT